MDKVTVSITYDVKFYFHDHYCITTCDKVVNTKSGKIISQFMRGSKKAFYCDGKICFVDDLKPIQKIICPF